MKTNLLWGDLHGDFRYLQRFIQSNPEISSITIAGDFGYGFPDTFDAPFIPNIPVYFIRGNHDNPQVREGFNWRNFNYIPDGAIINGVLFIGGAYSIDKDWRTPGATWWPEEELNQREQAEIIKKIEDYPYPIKLVVSHDCPTFLYKPAFNITLKSPSPTSEFLQYLYERILVGDKRPTHWYFGHHHSLIDITERGINFSCLGLAQHNRRVLLPNDIYD